MNVLFFLRKFLDYIFSPLSLIILLGLFFSLKRRSAFLFSLFLILWAISTTPVADRIVAPLEGGCRIPKLNKEIKDVVVLSGSIFNRKDAISSSGSSSLKRVLAALSLCKKLEGCRLYIAGGRVFNSKVGAEVLSKIAGYCSQKVKVFKEVSSKTTFENLKNIAALVKNRPFYLVTSCYHMKRSVMLARKMNLYPIPYPSDFLCETRYGFMDFFPRARNLRKVEVALHEYLGLAYYRFRFLFSPKHIETNGK